MPAPMLWLMATVKLFDNFPYTLSGQAHAAMRHCPLAQFKVAVAFS